MFTTIKIRNVSNNPDLIGLIDLLESIYAETYSYMDGENLDTAFRTTSGVRQGGCESPNCFNLYLDFILRIFDDECKSERVRIKYRIPNEATSRMQRSYEKSYGTLVLLWLGFADDLAILAKSVKDEE